MPFQDEFLIGVSPFLFKVKGGPMPPSFATTQNSFAKLAAVYQAGPEQKGQVAYREYRFYQRISEILTDAFLEDINAMSNLDPLQMFAATPGSRSLELFQELCGKADPESLDKMKQAADLQAQKDGPYFRLGVGNTASAAENRVGDPQDATPATDPNVVQAPGLQPGTVPLHGRDRVRTIMARTARAHPYPESHHGSVSSARTQSETQQPMCSSKRTPSNESIKTPATANSVTTTSTKTLTWMREKHMGSDRIYQEFLRRPKEQVTPACSECEAANEVCYNENGKKGRNGKPPACIRCGAWSRKCSNRAKYK